MYQNPHRIFEGGINVISLSIALFIIGGVGLVFSTIVRNPYTIQYPSALIIGVALFLVFRNRNSSKIPEYNVRVGKVALATFFIILAALMYQYHTTGFWRTGRVFHLTFLLYVVAGAYAFVRPNPWLVLPVIGITGITNRAMAYFSSEEYVGIDIYAHSRWSSSIAAEGSLEPLFTTKYYYAPLYHVQSAIGELVLGVPTKTAIAIGIMFLVTLVPLLGIYVFTSRFWDSRIGLFAGLLYTTSDHAIQWGIHLIPTSLGVVFFTIILVSIVSYVLSGDSRQFGILAVALGALVLTHQVSLFVSMVAVVAITGASILYQMKIDIRSVRIGLLSVFVVFFDFITTKYSGPKGAESFFDIVLGNFVFSLLTARTDNRPAISFPDNLSISPLGAPAMSNIQLLGSSLLLMLAIVGALYWLQSCRESDDTLVAFSIGVCVTVLFGFTLGAPIVGIDNLLPGRWWGFLYIGLVIFAAPGVFYLSTRVPFRGNKMGSHLVIVLLLLLPFVALMAGAPTASQDNPYMDGSFDAERLGVTEQEVAIGEHTENIRTEEIRVVSDHRFRYRTETVRMDHSNPDSIASETPKLILNRAYLSDRPAMYLVSIENKWWLVHGGVPINEMTPHYRSTVYHNGQDTLLYVSR
ncbi:hypothetical protein PM085_13310 [Halorubrum ezzemoulense]|uniref:Glycosyltransferase RgtA/B/C/D-like domain-containing protein n=1 Tax=Halorubrum ezzemoulense TaxID=337243 RepID=A0ABT4Z586_HALEZ|nr:hypothetical protein [Halorubrum ezzemoulense]MDB2293250.1 hypothetical protein [Halorubrum ezzemoulense]